MKMFHRVIGIVLCLALSGMVVAQGSSLAVVTVVQGVDVATLDPHDESSLTTRQIFFHLFDSLVHQNQQGELIPGLAESWEYLDARTARFHLREGVVWHDGTPFTADDVSFSFQRMTNPDLRATVFWGPIIRQLESWTVEDAHTIVLTWAQPNAAGLRDVGRQHIVPRHYIEDVGDTAFAMNPIGTGPFRFGHWTLGEEVVLERFDGFWGPTPRIASIVFKSMPDAATRVAALRTGAADIITGVAEEHVSLINASGVARTEAVASNRNAYVVLDERTFPLDILEVRQALNYAVDVQGIIEFVLGGAARQVPGPVAAGMFGFDPNLEPYPYDPEKARQLLAAAGFPNGFDVNFHYGPGRFLKDDEIAEAIAFQLGQVGVRVRLMPREWASFFPARNAGEVDGMHLLSIGGLDPDGQVRYLESTRNGNPYTNHPELDALIASQVVTVDTEARRALLFEVQRLSKELAPWIFLFDLENIYGVSNRLDWTPWANDYIWLRESGPTN